MTILVTGAAGFIGCHLCQALLGRGEAVLGLDSLNDYYDPALKQARLGLLEGQGGFAFQQFDIADADGLAALCDSRPDIEAVVHLAAQAGVRYSLEHPFAYVEANVKGHLAVLEACRRLPRLQHLVYASSSSVYGANEKVPFAIEDRVDHPVSLYAATKRSAELVSECYGRLYGLPMTGLRFFTVYGPWGRPDMAYYSFAKAIFEGREIRLYNHGRMRRDFTFIDDIIAGTLAALERTPQPDGEGPPHRIYNLGNNRSEALLDFVAALERACGRPAKTVLVEMQPGEVVETFADIEASRRDLGFDPKTAMEDGLPRFVAWFRQYHGV